MLARRVEQPGQERRGAAHLPFGLQTLQAQHHRGAMLAQPRGESADLRHGIIRRLDHDMAVGGAERHEIALRIDHDLLHLSRRALEQAAQQVRLSRPRIPLHQQAGGEQLF